MYANFELKRYSINFFFQSNKSDTESHANRYSVRLQNFQSTKLMNWSNVQ